MSDEQLRPPASWDKFEEICADLFSRVWKTQNSSVTGEAARGKRASTYTDSKMAPTPAFNAKENAFGRRPS
ncbi:hypothetical protein [Bradyrhizobium sp. UFLA05-112]